MAARSEHARLSAFLLVSDFPSSNAQRHNFDPHSLGPPMLLSRRRWGDLLAGGRSRYRRCHRDGQPIQPKRVGVRDRPTPAVTVASPRHQCRCQSFTKTTTPFAGITIEADAIKPCIGPPLASTPCPFPATQGLTQLS